jgi:hypothetical protein
MNGEMKRATQFVCLVVTALLGAASLAQEASPPAAVELPIG